MGFSEVKKVEITLNLYNKILEGSRLGLFKVDDFLAYQCLSTEQIKRGVHLICSIYAPGKSSGHGRIHLGDRDCFYTQRVTEKNEVTANEKVERKTAKTWKIVKVQSPDGKVNLESDYQTGYLYKQQADAEAKRLNDTAYFCPELGVMPLYVVKNEDETVTVSVLETDDYWKEDDETPTINTEDDDGYWSDVALG